MRLRVVLGISFIAVRISPSAFSAVVGDFTAYHHILLCPAGWLVGGEWRFIYCEENVVPKNAARQIGNYGPKLNSALHILARFMAAASLTTHTHHTHYPPSGRDKPHIYRSKFFIRI